MTYHHSSTFEKKIHFPKVQLFLCKVPSTSCTSYPISECLNDSGEGYHCLCTRSSAGASKESFCWKLCALSKDLVIRDIRDKRDRQDGPSDDGCVIGSLMIFTNQCRRQDIRWVTGSRPLPASISNVKLTICHVLSQESCSSVTTYGSK